MASNKDEVQEERPKSFGEVGVPGSLREYEKQLEDFEKSVKAVNHPSHYNCGNIETIEAIDDWGWTVGFCAGNAIKYVSRHEHKGKPIEDLEKAAWYINHLIEYYKKNQKND